MRVYGGAQVDVAEAPAVTRRDGAAALAAPSGPQSDREFDARIVASAVRAQATRIKRCYEIELAQNHTLRGTIRIEFVIMPDGEVVAVTATENTVSPGVGECVVAVIDSIRISPGPTGGYVRFRFPFTFEPGG